MAGGDGIQSGLNQLAPGGRLRQQLFKAAAPRSPLPLTGESSTHRAAVTADHNNGNL
jgi:hypothetical protein